MNENKAELQSWPDDTLLKKEVNSERGVKSKEAGLSIKERLWSDSSYRQKVIYSLLMSASFASLGMYLGQHGPTFLDIQVLTNTDLEEASAFFTGGNAGHLTGCILTGLLYSKMDASLLQFLVTAGMGLTNMVLPYCTQFELMVLIRFVSAAFGGGIANSLNTGHLALWGSEANGLLQFSHFVFSVGGMLSPLFSEPFLLHKKDLDSAIVANGNNITSTPENSIDITDVHLSYNISSSGGSNSISNSSIISSSSSSNSDIVSLAPESKVKYVFFITGIFAVLTALPFIVIFIKKNQKQRDSSGSRMISQRDIPCSLIVMMLIGVCFFDLLYLCVETTQFNYLMAFLVEEFGVSKSKGAFITALGWGSFAAARFLMIFMTRLFSPLKLLVMLSTLLAVAQCAFAVFAHFGIISALIVFSAISAFAMSGIFPASLSWAEMELFHVTGIFTSCVVVSSSVGNMINPLFLGYFMENFSNMWYSYILLIESVLMCLTLFVLLIFSRFYVNRKYGVFVAIPDCTITTELANLQTEKIQP